MKLQPARSLKGAQRANLGKHLIEPKTFRIRREPRKGARLLKRQAIIRAPLAGDAVIPQMFAVYEM